MQIGTRRVADGPTRASTWQGCSLTDLKQRNDRGNSQTISSHTLRFFCWETEAYITTNGQQKKTNNNNNNNNNKKQCVVSLDILDILMWQRRLNTCIYMNDILRASKHVIIKTHKETDRQTVWETGTQEGRDRKTAADTMQSKLSKKRKFQANFRGQIRQESSPQVLVVKDQSAGATGKACDTWWTTDSPSSDNPNATGININTYMALHNDQKRIVPLTGFVQPTETVMKGLDYHFGVFNQTWSYNL